MFGGAKYRGLAFKLNALHVQADASLLFYADNPLEVSTGRYRAKGAVCQQHGDAVDNWIPSSATQARNDSSPKLQRLSTDWADSPAQVLCRQWLRVHASILDNHANHANES